MAYTGSAELLSDFLTFNDLVEHEHNEDKGVALAADRHLIKLNIDYTKFSNHCWFNSAYTKTYNAFYRIQNFLNHDDTYGAIQEFYYSGTQFDQHIYDGYPREVGYIDFQAGANTKPEIAAPQYITGSDPHCYTMPGTGSWTFECWVKPYSSASVYANCGLFGKRGDTETLLVWSTPKVGSRYIALGIASASTVAFKTQSLPPDAWSYVAFVYDRPHSWLTIFTASATQRPVMSLSASFAFKDLYCYDSTGANPFYVGSASISIIPVQVFTGCFDEMRIWRTNLSASFIADYYNQSVHPDHNNLVLYYKFNEGLTSTASIDCQIKDHSGNDLNGYVKNYLLSSSICRVSGATLLREEGTILHPQNSRTSVYQTEWLSSGSIYDEYNDQLITRQIPEHHIEDDTDGSLTKYLYALAESLDELQLYQEHFVNLGAVNYTGKDSCPDELLPQYAHNEGFEISPLFEAGNVLQQFFGENILLSGSTAQHSIDELKKMVWRRIANNVTYFLKTKGTPKSIKGLLNAVGLDERQIKVKRYSFLPGERIDDNRVYSYVARPFLFLSGAGRYVGKNYPYTQATSNMREVCWMWDSASTLLTSSVASIYDDTNSVLYGDLRWHTSDDYKSGSLYVAFNKAAPPALALSSSIMPFSADNRYHAAFGRRANADGTTEILLYWAMYDVDRILYSGCMSSSTTTWAVTDVWERVGSNVDGVPTWGYFSEYRYWGFALNFNEFLAHVWDPRNVGTYDPLTRSASVHLPLDTYNVNGTSVYVDDVVCRVMYTGVIGATPTNPFINKTVFYKYLSQDFIWNEDDIRIRNATELKKSEQAIDGGIVSLEMNPIDSMNEDMGRIFSTNRLHNDIVGAPINKLRPYYDFRKYQQKYFNKYVTHMEFNKYFDAYKWVDANLTKMVEQLVDATRKYYGAQFVIEPHALETQKATYQYSVYKTPFALGYADYSGVVAETGTLDRQSPSTGSDNTPALAAELTYGDQEFRKCGNYGGAAWTASAQYDPFVTTDGFNYRNSMIVVASHSSSVEYFTSSAGRACYKQEESGTFLTDNKGINYDSDFERMNLRHYYTLRIFGAGTFNNTTQLTTSNDTRGLAYHCDIRGFRANQIYIDLEISGGLGANYTNIFFKPPWSDDLTPISGVPVEKINDYLFRVRCNATPSAPASTANKDYNLNFDISGSYAFKIKYGSDTDYIVRHFDIVIDAYSTASIVNEQLARNFTEDWNDHTMLDGNFTYFYIMDDLHNKGAPLYLPEETDMVQLKTYDGESKTHVMSASHVGGIHYSNVGGIIYDGLYKGTKSYGRMGVTDRDLIKVEQVGSKIVVLWPNQLDLGTDVKSKDLMLQNAYGAYLTDATTWYHGQTYYLDDDYDTLTLWCYSFYKDGTLESPPDIINLDMAVMESPFSDGPMTMRPLLSSSLAGGFNNKMRMVNNVYRMSYSVTPTTLTDNEWISYKTDISIKGLKRVRISAMHNSVHANDPSANRFLNNLIVFGQFSKNGITGENTGAPSNIMFDADSNMTS